MILVEGYTDVLALHQAEMRNAVGIMGTALTEEQVRELGRVVRVLELCLDADSAGQDAMLRAARLAQGRNPPLELRVVPLPDGTDPAELVEREGGEALRGRVDQSVPFVVFHADRILERADIDSAEGRDQALLQLRPVLAELPPSVLRDELLRKVAGRLGLTDRQLARLISSEGGGRGAAGGRGGGGVGAGGQGGGAGGQQRRARDDDGERRAVPGENEPDGWPGRAGPVVRRMSALDHSLRPERAFLSMCIAVPDEGATALAQIDPDALLTSQVLRRAARHLAAGHTRTPLADLPADDDELPAVLAHLVGLAGRVSDPTPARLAHARLLLELARVERDLARARAGQAGGITALAREREDVLAAIHGVVTRLEKAV
jgi:DNA primase